MLRTIIARVFQGTISLGLIVILVFLMARLTGSPARHYLPADAPPEMVTAFEIRHGLDKPMAAQFVDFLDGLWRLDLGQSLMTGRPAMEIVFNRYPLSLALAGLAMLCALSIGITLGVLASTRPGSLLDRFISSASLLAYTTPQFWVGIMAILIFAVMLGVLPTSGRGDSWRYWILPVATMSWVPIGMLSHVVRTAMIETLGADYIKVARGKGVRPAAVFLRHALRNAAIPTLTVAGTIAAGVVNGAIIVEEIFGFPGVGSLTIEAIRRRDFAVLQAATFVTAGAVILVNLLVDIAYTWVNPQVHYD